MTRPAARWCALLVWLCVAAGGAPATAKSDKADAKVKRARAEILALLNEPAAGDPIEAALREEATRHALGLVEVRAKFVGPNGTPLAGVDVVALHEAFDVRCGPVKTSGSGHATLRLPRGAWRIDASSPQLSGGRALLARFAWQARGPGEVELQATERRKIRFVTKDGASARVSEYVLAHDDGRTGYVRASATTASVELLCAAGQSVRVQAVQGGKGATTRIVRTGVPASGGEVVLNPDGASRWTFAGSGRRPLVARVYNADAMPFELLIKGSGKRLVSLHGMPTAAVHLTAGRGRRACEFYPQVFSVDGAERTFSGSPPFKVSVGVQLLHRTDWKEQRNAVVARFYLRDDNGLVVAGKRAGAPYPIEYEEYLDGKLRASGGVARIYADITPPIDPARVKDLRYHVRPGIKGMPDTIECKAHLPDTTVEHGRVRTIVHHEIAAFARPWTAYVDEMATAYEATSWAKCKLIKAELDARMPPNMLGLGGRLGDDVAFVVFDVERIFGFVRSFKWDGLTSHELGHAYNYWHSNPAEDKQLHQAGSRASWWFSSRWPDPERKPYGTVMLPLLEGVTAGKFPTGKKAEGHAGWVFRRDTDYTGGDAVWTWYGRAVLGPEKHRTMLGETPGASWTLVRAGFSDGEIRAALLTRAIGTPHGWFARLRGAQVTDARVEEAVALIEKTPSQTSKVRRAIAAQWMKLDAAETRELLPLIPRMHAELGHREARIELLTRIGAEYLRRKDRESGRKALLEAMREARRAELEVFERASWDIAARWLER